MWVVRKTARFYWHLAKTYQICRRLSGSRPEEGSSKNTILGSPTKLIAIDSLLFIPPESEDETKCLNSVKWTYDIAYLIRISS
jgi:hypothetical protein